MDPKEHIKNKNRLMKSILSNPKLAKTFSEAVGAQIGSTKREQAKSMFSVMKKMGKVNDGQGGFLQDIGNNVKNFFGANQAPNPQTPLPTTPNYGNMIVFKSAPAFKTTTTPSTPTDTSKMGLTLNPLNSSAGLTGTNIFNTPGKKSVNGVVITPPAQTLNTDPNQSIAPATPFKTITPPSNINFKDMGLNLTAPVTRPTSSILSGIKNDSSTKSIPLPWNFTPSPTSMSTDLMKEYKPPVPPVDTTKVTPEVPKPEVIPDPTKINIIPGTNTGTPTGTTQHDGYFNGITSAVKYTAQGLGVDPQELTTTGIKDIANQYGEDIVINKLIPLIVGDEGGSPNGVNNNPGNIKYEKLPGQTDSGVHPTDDPEGTFASYATPALGQAAMAGLLKNIIKGGTSYGDNPTVAQVINGWKNLTGDTSVSTSGGSSYSGATTLNPNAYIAANTGPAAYGEDVAKAYFNGRDLNQVIIDDIAAKKKEFGIAEAEQALSDLVSKKANIIPTLTTFIKGKDQYLSFIDTMIDKMNDSITETDMGDPAVANAYNRQLNYLYTLKGRQTERYSNFLTAATADYQADVDRATNNYNTLKDDYQTAVEQKTTMDSNTYNNLMTRGAAMYTEIQNAPILKENLTALQIQNLTNYKILANDGINQANSTDPTLNKQKLEYINQLSQGAGPNDPKIFNPNVLLEGGLGGFYQSIMDSQGNPAAVTDAIATTMKAGVLAPTADINTISTYMKLLKDLERDPNPQGEIYANAILPTVLGSAKAIISSYVSTNLKAIKKAIEGLSNGPVDKNSWKSKNSGVYDFLTDALYDVIVMDPTYKTDPKKGISMVLNGNDTQIASTLATMISG